MVPLPERSHELSQPTLSLSRGIIRPLSSEYGTYKIERQTDRQTDRPKRQTRQDSGLGVHVNVLQKRLKLFPLGSEADWGSIKYWGRKLGEYQISVTTTLQQQASLTPGAGTFDSGAVRGRLRSNNWPRLHLHRPWGPLRSGLRSRSRG